MNGGVQDAGEQRDLVHTCEEPTAIAQSRDEQGCRVGRLHVGRLMGPRRLTAVERGRDRVAFASQLNQIDPRI